MYWYQPLLEEFQKIVANLEFIKPISRTKILIGKKNAVEDCDHYKIIVSAHKKQNHYSEAVFLLVIKILFFVEISRKN
jgi:hypothetical protein